MSELTVVVRRIESDISMRRDYVSLPRDYGKDSYFQRLDIQEIRNLVFRTLDTLEEAVTQIEQVMQNALEREVTSQQIGELAMEKLRKIDQVAYVRFASVYRQFKDINSFLAELKNILESDGGEKPSAGA